MKSVKILLSLAIIIISFVLSIIITLNSVSSQKIKNDFAELNNVKYGLFSVEEWERQITIILANEINKLDLSEANERALRRHIEVLLNTLIDKLDKNIRKENSGSAGGWVQQTFINIFINLKEIKKNIPEYANAIIREIKKSKTKAQIKTLLNKQLLEYSDQTYEMQDKSQMNRILLRTGAKDIESAKVDLHKEISMRHKLAFREATLLIILSVVLFALSGFKNRHMVPFQYVLLILSLLMLLSAGVTTPMIDLEAKISQMSFVLMGHPINFENQILYFQSKSILDVFWIMITHKDMMMKLVGVLLLSFSIIIPVLKITTAVGYYFNYHEARKSPVIQYIVFKSGKWSMADVMVVAIFMAYIGFNGIITGLFNQINTSSQDLVIITTNGTSLQPGYFLFMTYTLLALCFSGILGLQSESQSRLRQ